MKAMRQLHAASWILGHIYCLTPSRMEPKRYPVALYWTVQPYRPGARVQPERRCAGFGDVIAKIRKFRSTNTDPKKRLRVYAPAHAPDRERQEIVKLGVEVI